MTNIFGQIVATKNTVNIFDDWDEEKVDELHSAISKKTLLEFNDDPLAIVIDLLAQNYPLYEIHAFLSSQENNTTIRAKISSEPSKEQAKKIRFYFKNRLIMRRLKNQHISDFMNSLEQIMSDDYRIYQDHISILVKLPDFYRENIETDSLFKNYISLDEASKTTTVHLEENLTFVKAIIRQAKNQNIKRLYFKNDKNNLLLHSVPTNSENIQLWDYIIKQNKPIGFKGTVRIAPQIGFDFKLYQGNYYEFY